MTNYKEYYNLCKKKYNSNKNYENIYKFTIKKNPIIKPKNYNNIINKLINRVTNIFDTSKNLKKNNFLIGFQEDIYNLEEDIENICQIIIPQLEKNIYGCNLHLFRVYIYKNLITNTPPNSSWLWHWDNHIDESLKVIIYLTDVTKNDGAFEYLQNETKNGGIRMPSNRFGPKKWGKKDHPIHKKCRISNEFIKNYKNCIPIKIEGKKGDCILFSQNIIHRATVPTNNERIILTLQLKPILNKLPKYFDKKYTKTFHNEISAQGLPDPYKLI